MSRPQRECKSDHCRRPTRSISGRCEDHRKPVPVSSDGHSVNIGPTTVSAAAALDLADRIVDAIEGNTDA